MLRRLRFTGVTCYRRLILIKLHYILLMGGMGTLYPNLGIIAKTLKIPSSAFSIFSGIMIAVILAVFIRPLFGALADKYVIHRKMLFGAAILLLIFLFPINLIHPPKAEFVTTVLKSSDISVLVCFDDALSPSIIFSTEMCTWTCVFSNETCAKWGLTKECNDIPHVPGYCQTGIANYDIKLSGSECQVSCVHEGISRDVAIEADDDSLQVTVIVTTWQFWAVCILLSGGMMSYMIAMSISDTVNMKICKDPHLFGNQVFCGTLSYGLTYVATYFIVKSASNFGEDRNYKAAYYLLLLFGLLDLLAIINLEFTFPVQSENIYRDIRTAFRKLRSKVYIIWALVAGVSHGVLSKYDLWFLEDVALEHGSDAINFVSSFGEPLVVLTEMCGDAPAFLYGHYIIQKVGFGHTWTIIFLSTALRNILYSIQTNPFFIFPLHIIQYNYGLSYLNMTLHAFSIALPGTETAVLCFVNALYHGLGSVLGYFVGGILYKGIGKHNLFLTLGIMYLLFGILSEAIEALLRWWEKKTSSNVGELATGT